MNEFENDAIFDSEYDDALVLTGIDDPVEQEELLGRIWRNPKRRRRFVRHAFKPRAQVATGRGTTSRDEFQRRFSQLPKETKKGLLNKQKQLVDTALYVVKDVSNSKVVKMFQDDDNKVVGKSNVSGGKLEKGNFFTLKAIQILVGYGSVGEGWKTASFNTIPSYIRNGEFELVANGSVLIPRMSMEVFNTQNNYDVKMGYYELENPKMIETQQPLDKEIEWAQNMQTGSFIKAVLYGTSVAKH